MDIVKQLTINASPKNVPNGSIVAAKNIVLDKAASYITREPGLSDRVSIVNSILSEVEGEDTVYEDNSIVGVIPFTDKLIILSHDAETDTSRIFSYDDENGLIEYYTGWKWSGGKITGSASYNYKKEIILAIAESSDEEDVPLKVYNLNNTNTLLTGNTEEEIPQLLCTPYITNAGNLLCGTYTYFIRYKISENNYTKWFQITSDIQIIDSYDKEPPFHTHLYLDNDVEKRYTCMVLPKDGGNFRHSLFVLNGNSISSHGICIRFSEAIQSNVFDTYQIGAIIKRNTSVVGRIIGEYNRGIQVIDIIDNTYIEEIDVDEFLKSPTQYYNVKNAVVYNNRLYISNYSEYKDLSENCKNAADSVIGKFTKHTVNETPISIDTNTYDTTINLKLYDDGVSPYYISGTASNLTLNTRNEITNPISSLIVDLFAKNLPNLNITFYFLNAGGVNTGFLFNNVPLNDISFFDVSDRGIYVSNSYSDYELTKVKNLCVIPSIGLFKVDGERKKFELFKAGYKTYKGIVNTTNTYYGQPILDDTSGSEYIEFQNSNLEPPYRIKANEDESTRIYIMFDVYWVIDGTQGGRTGSTNIHLSYSYLKMTSETSGYVLNSYNEYIINSHYDGFKSYVGINFNPATNDFTAQSEINNNRSLIPYQKYNFFIHYVRKDGSCTNGFKIGKLKRSDVVYNVDLFEPKLSDTDSTNKAIGIEFENITNPDSNEYVGWFVSYEKIVKTSIPAVVLTREVKNGNQTLLTVSSSVITYLDELITATKLNTTNDSNLNVSFVSSKTDNKGTQTPNYTFLVNTDITATVNVGDVVYFTTEPTNLYTNEYKILYRLTDTYYSWSDGVNSIEQNNYKYLPGFYCKEAFVVFIDIEYNGTENLPLQNIIGSSSSNYVIKAYTSPIDGDETRYDIYVLTPYTYSHVNLAALSIKQDYSEGSFVWSRYEGDDQRNTTIHNKALLPDMICNFLELLPAYTALPDKIYTNHRVQYNTSFNKRIRRSNVLSDENNTIGFRTFEADNYKIIFENKGDIVNLEGIGLYFLIHTEYSLYFIDRNSRLTSSAQLVIPDTFDTTYQEASPSNEGFGGLSDKKEAILTKYGYIWLDKKNKYIFIYDSGKMSVLSKDINYLLQNETILSARFAEDVKRNRLLICLCIANKFEDGDEIYLTLSYSFDTGTFISLHDYKFIDAYNTYNELYLQGEYVESEPINALKNTLYSFNKDAFIASALAYSNNIMFDSYIINYRPKPHAAVIKLPVPYIDIVFNESYEMQKVLDSISYVLSMQYPITYNKNFDTILERTYCGSKLLIYTDNVNTGLIDISQSDYNNVTTHTDEDENVRVIAAPDYKKPYYEKGIWNFNYFRALLGEPSKIIKTGDNADTKLDNVDIMTASPDDYPNKIILSEYGIEGIEYYSRNCYDKPLVYGKYFVIRFRFDDLNEFKLESLSINAQKY